MAAPPLLAGTLQDTTDWVLAFEVAVTAVGWLKEENGLLVLSVRDSSQTFLLFEDSAREKEVHSGKQPKLLAEATESALRKLMEEHTLLAVTGKIHDHAKVSAGLLIEKYAIVLPFNSG